MKQRENAKQFISQRLWTCAITKNSDSEEKFQKQYKDRVVLRRDVVKDDCSAYAAFTEEVLPHHT